MPQTGILYHPMVDATLAKAQEVQKFLSARGVATWRCSAWDTAEIRKHLEDTALVLTVGGDGTLLRAAQAVYPSRVPITGINMGRLGFMTELSAAEAAEKLPDLLAGKGWVDARTMLSVTLAAPPAKRQTFTALNDVVMARGAIARMVRITASMADQRFATYRADGVVVATATGSTGYALAAGGAILYPRSPDFILVPVAAHTSAAYALVLPAETVLKLRIDTVHEATLSVDGHINRPLPDGAEITVRRSRHQTRFLRIHPEDRFYRSLEEKLRGKE
ncbi:MAG: NAD(+)/NADH kinase [Chloroflexota bacterium]